MLIRILSVICLGLMTVSTLAYSSNLDDFNRIDIDQDGMITETEFVKMAVDRVFPKLLRLQVIARNVQLNTATYNSNL